MHFVLRKGDRRECGFEGGGGLVEEVFVKVKLVVRSCGGRGGSVMRGGLCVGYVIVQLLKVVEVHLCLEEFIATSSKQ